MALVVSRHAQPVAGLAELPQPQRLPAFGARRGAGRAAVDADVGAGPVAALPHHRHDLLQPTLAAGLVAVDVPGQLAVGGAQGLPLDRHAVPDRHQP
ncbi:hypothetical protein EG878_16945, partial [Enterococcus faecalis]